MRHARHRPVLGVILAILAAGCTSPAAGSGTATASTTSAPTTSRTASATSGTASATTATTATSSTPGTVDERWVPSADDNDPSVDIAGIYVGDPALYAQRYHFAQPDRVAYDRCPPVGGPHDPTWADCDGTVYDVPIRVENLVHSMEHGAVWIAYNPDTIDPADLTRLKGEVPTVSYLVMTPYPGLSTPLSLQSWGHQLALDSRSDERFLQFVEAQLRNPYTTPELGATCSNPGFDPAAYPFDPTPPGPTAIPLDYRPPAETGPTTS